MTTTITLNAKSDEKAGGVTQYAPTLFGDERFQMRKHMNRDAIQRYAEATAKLPAVDVWLDKSKGVYYIVDGYQRTEAHLLAYADALKAAKDMADGGAKSKAIKAAEAFLALAITVHEFSEADALAFAATANFGHGEKLTVDDRENSVLALGSIWGKQVRKIADAVSMSPGNVSRIFAKEDLRDAINKLAKANDRPAFAHDDGMSSSMLWEVLNLPAALAKSQGRTAGRTKTERGGLSDVEIMAKLATLAFDKKLNGASIRQAVKWATEPVYWSDKVFAADKWLAYVASKASGSATSRDRQLAQLTSDLMELAGIKIENAFRKSYTKQDLQVAAKAIDKAAGWLRDYGAAITDRITRYAQIQADAKKVEAEAAKPKANGKGRASAATQKPNNKRQPVKPRPEYGHRASAS